MSRVAVTESSLTAIANSIRTKNGTQATYKPSQMSGAISDLPTSIDDYVDNVISYSDSSDVPGWLKTLKKLPGVVYMYNGDLSRSFAEYKGNKIPRIEANSNLGIYATNMYNTFANCSNITSLDLSYLDVSRVTNFTNSFYHCSNLESLDLSNWNTGNATTISQCFAGCSKLKTIKGISNFNTSNVTNMGSVFSNCLVLETLDLTNWDTSKTTDIGQMFGFCYKLKNVTFGSNFKIDKATSMSRFFIYDYDLEQVDLSYFDFKSVVELNDFFNGCTKLEELTFGTNLGQGYLTTRSANYNSYTLNLSSTKLTHDSLMSVINNLYDIATAGVQTQKLILGNTLLSKLDSNEIAIATNKGWSVS